MLFWVSIGLEWPLDDVGNAFQLLGVTVAALGVPVVPPFLARIEQALSRAIAAVRRWARDQRRAIQAWWARLRGRPHFIDLAGAAGATAGGHAHVTVTRGKVDRDTISDRDWLAFLNDEVDAIWERLRLLDESRQADWAEFERRLASQSEDLRAHTLTVTREGWQYVVAGVICSWYGTLLALVA